MLLQFENSLEESIVRVLAHSPGISANQLRSLIARQFGSYSIRGVYKELAKLERQGVVLKVKASYSLRLAWVIELSSFVDGLYDRYLSPSIFGVSLGLEKTKLHWNFKNLIKMDLAATQLILGLVQIYPNKPICLWCPHQWFNLAHGKSISQFFRANEVAGIRRYHIIGGRTYLDTLGASYLPPKSIYSSAVSPFEDLRSTYYMLIGEHLLTTKIDQSTTERIEQLFEEVQTSAALKKYPIQDFFEQPVKAKMTLELNPRKTHKIKKQFAEFFGVGLKDL